MEARYTEEAVEITVMREMFNYCVKDPKGQKAYCDELNYGTFQTEGGVRYQRYINMQVERGGRGEIGKDELIYTIDVKGRELRDANRKDLAEWQKDNPTVLERLRKIQAGGGTAYSRPLHCTTMALGGGMSTTNCN